MSGASGLPRLLRGIEDGGTLTLAQHVRVHGALETSGRDAGARLLDAIEDSGLRGRGGAHVSSALKLRAVAGRRRRAVVVANGSESEPASRKDAVLLTHTPHLVIDGAIVAATAVGADEVVLYVKRSNPRVWAGVLRAVDERRAAGARGPTLRIVAAPDSYVSGQETAAIAHINGRPALPTTVPPRPFERGVDNRPTFISNVETLAHMALIARHGADWFRALGSPTQPGSVLVTLGGAVDRPGVYEIAFGSRLADLLRAAGGVSERPQALLVGGYGGAWLDAQHMQDLTLSEGDPLLAAGSIGAGVLWVLGEDSCGVWETGRVLDYLADAERRPVRTVPAWAARHRRQLRPPRPRYRAPGRAHAAEALGGGGHGPRRVPSPRRRRALPRQRPRGLRRRDRGPPGGPLRRRRTRRRCRCRPRHGRPHEQANDHPHRSDHVRRPRPVRRVAARAHPPRRLGLPDRRRRAGPARPRQARAARRGRLPDPRPAAGDPP